MPTFTKLKSGTWRVQVRRKSQYVANTFIRRRDAEEWAIETERSIDRGTPIRRSKSHEQPRIFSDLIALHLDDLAQVGKPVRRSKSMVLRALKTSLGRVNLKDITREKLIEFGRKRAAQGAGPATLAIDFAFIRAILPTLAWQNALSQKRYQSRPLCCRAKARQPIDQCPHRCRISRRRPSRRRRSENAMTRSRPGIEIMISKPL